MKNPNNLRYLIKAKICQISQHIQISPNTNRPKTPTSQNNPNQSYLISPYTKNQPYTDMVRKRQAFGGYGWTRNGRDYVSQKQQQLRERDVLDILVVY